MLYRVENSVRKGEISCYSKYSFSHNVFQSYKSLERQNATLSLPNDKILDMPNLKAIADLKIYVHVTLILNIAYERIEAM